MLRYTVPVLGFVGATYVWYYNTSNAGRSALLLPFLDQIPSLQGDIDGQAMWAWIIAYAIAAAVLLITIIGHLHERDVRRAAEEE